MDLHHFAEKESRLAIRYQPVFSQGYNLQGLRDLKGEGIVFSFLT